MFTTPSNSVNNIKQKLATKTKKLLKTFQEKILEEKKLHIQHNRN